MKGRKKKIWPFFAPTWETVQATETNVILGWPGYKYRLIEFDYPPQAE